MPRAAVYLVVGSRSKRFEMSEKTKSIIAFFVLLIGMILLVVWCSSGKGL
jgi:hypothetical protein